MSYQDRVTRVPATEVIGLFRTRRWVIGPGPAVGVFAAACERRQAAPESPSFSGPPVQIHAFVRQPVRLFGEIMERRVRDYEAARQGRITVLWEPEASDFEKKLTSMIAAGNPPVVTDLNLDQFPNWAAQGVLRSLEPFVKQDRGFSLGDFYSRLIDASRWRGALGRIPHYAAPYPLYYNRNLFQAKGVALPHKEWSWKDLREAGLKLTSHSEGVWGFEANSSVTWWIGHYWSEGAELLDKDHTKCTIDTPQAVAAIDWYAGLRSKDRIAPSSAELQGQNRDVMFATGKFAAYTAPFSRANQLIDLNKGLFEWDIQIPPKGSVKREHRLGDGGLAIPAGMAHAEQGWDFIKWMAGPETQREWAGERLNMPSWRSVAESDAFLKTRPPNNIRAMADMMATARHLWPIPNQGLAGIFSSGMVAVMDGKQSALEACQDMKRRVDAWLEQERPRWKPLAGA